MALFAWDPEQVAFRASSQLKTILHCTWAVNMAVLASLPLHLVSVVGCFSPFYIHFWLVSDFKALTSQVTKGCSVMDDV